MELVHPPPDLTGVKKRVTKQPAVEVNRGLTQNPGQYTLPNDSPERRASSEMAEDLVGVVDQRHLQNFQFLQLLSSSHSRIDVFSSFVDSLYRLRDRVSRED